MKSGVYVESGLDALAIATVRQAAWDYNCYRSRGRDDKAEEIAEWMRSTLGPFAEVVLEKLHQGWEPCDASGRPRSRCGGRRRGIEKRSTEPDVYSAIEYYMNVWEMDTLNQIIRESR